MMPTDPRDDPMQVWVRVSPDFATVIASSTMATMRGTVRHPRPDVHDFMFRMRSRGDKAEPLMRIVLFDTREPMCWLPFVTSTAPFGEGIDSPSDVDKIIAVGDYSVVDEKARRREHRRERPPRLKGSR